MKIKCFLITFAFACFSYASDYDDDYEDFVGDNDDSYATVATPSTSNNSFNSPNVYSSYNAPAQYHSGFYYESSLGLGYSKFSVKQYKYGLSSYSNSETFDKVSLSGFGPAFDFKFGGIISSLVAIYGSFDYSAAFGSLKYRSNTNGAEDRSVNYSGVSLYRTAFGAGVTLFPFRDFNNPLYGFFFGAQFNVAIITADDYYDFKQYLDSDNYYWMYDNIDVYAVGFTLEVGKVWNLGGRWNLGIQGKFMFDSPYSSSEITSRSSDDDADYNCFSFSINFIVIRK